jgi:hypothetical protein
MFISTATVSERYSVQRCRTLEKWKQRDSCSAAGRFHDTEAAWLEFTSDLEQLHSNLFFYSRNPRYNFPSTLYHQIIGL